MDANTKDVLMALIALISAVVTPLIVVYVNRLTMKKVEGYHKEVNGKMGQLLETTASLATATEKARQVEADAQKRK